MTPCARGSTRAVQTTPRHRKAQSFARQSSHGNIAYGVAHYPQWRFASERAAPAVLLRCGKAMSLGLEPRTLEFDQDGNPYSYGYGDHYASRDGALGQAQHVFLGGNDLPRRWAGRRQFVIVETGFGLGTNFLATWQAWRNDPQRPQRLHFVSLEKHPLRAQDLRTPARSTPARAADPSPGCDALGDLRSQLAARWPLLVAGLHRIEFDDARVALTLALGDALAIACRLQLGADAFYLDGFAPDRNPEMWDPRLLRALARLARTDATAATYTCARAVREALAASGFEIELQKGFGGKREMLRARFAPRWKMRPLEPPAAYAGEQRAIVVGAGLAGCASAYALRRRGWRVTLLERAGASARGASGLPAGLLHPLLSADDNLASRLSRAGYLFSQGLLEHLDQPLRGIAGQELWARCGVFQQADNAELAQLLRARLEQAAWPEEYAVFLDAKKAAARIGLAPRHGGIWFARGAVVAVPRWCSAMIEAGRSASNVSAAAPGAIFDSDVCRVERIELGWRVQDRKGRRYEAPVLVLANAIDLARLLDLRHAPMQELGGRISLLKSPALAELRAGISGEGYLIPPLLGSAAVGATYDPYPASKSRHDGSGGTEALADDVIRDHRANLQRLAQLLAQAPAAAPDGDFSGRRCTSQDRLPLAGAVVDETRCPLDAARYRGAHLADLPRLPGLYCLSALGSRGLSLAPLLGELLASQINGEPAPIEVPLCAAVDPGRFLLRYLR